MKPPIRIFSIEIDNLTRNITWGGSPLKNGCLNVITDRKPEFIFERDGNCFYAEDSGFVSAYQYVPGTNDGFAGREIRLRVKGGIVFKSRGWHWETFKGSLWDSVEPYRRFEQKYGTTLYSCAQNDRTAHRKCPVYCSCTVTKERFDWIMECMLPKS